MKKIILILALVFVSATAYAEQEIYAFTDYTPVRIMYIAPGSDVQVESEKAGLSGARKKISASDIPDDRSDREAWKFKSGKIEAESKLKQEIEIRKEEQIQKKSNLVGKLKGLGLDDDDLSVLGVKI